MESLKVSGILKAASIARSAGREIATPDEAREIMGIRKE
jgi:uncharacterized protein (DUF849 family)